MPFLLYKPSNKVELKSPRRLRVVTANDFNTKFRYLSLIKEMKQTSATLIKYIIKSIGNDMFFVALTLIRAMVMGTLFKKINGA